MRIDVLLKGGFLVYNPTIAKVRVHYDIFMESYEKQKNLQALTARSLETLASMRDEADTLILDIWNQVERKYAEVMPNEKTLGFVSRLWFDLLLPYR